MGFVNPNVSRRSSKTLDLIPMDSKEGSAKKLSVSVVVVVEDKKRRTTPIEDR